MDDHTTRKAFSALAHPATLAAVLLLLVNDHLLRQLWPSWLTGKLGDFAWLFAAPLALAAALTLLLPRRLVGRERLAGGVAFAAVGGIFALAKTWPAGHALVVAAAEAILRFPVGWRRDPTDLVALLALAAAWRLWTAATGDVSQDSIPVAGDTGPAESTAIRVHPCARASHCWGGRAARPRPTRAAAGWIILPLAALLTVANSPMPEPGVFCLTAADGALHAYSGRGRYISADGGLSWQPTAEAGPWPETCRSPWSPASEPLLLTDPRDPNLRYRAIANQHIELSEDGGQTWREAYRIRATGELEAARLNRRGILAERQDMPLDGLVDPATGNAVFAMGHLGALVRLPDGAWRMVAVGDFRQGGEGGVQALLRLLIGEALLALGVGLLTLVTLGRRFAGQGLWRALRSAGWLLWGACVLVFPPALAEGYGGALSALAMLAAGLVILICVARAATGLVAADRRFVGRLLAVAAAVALLFLLPYVLWGLGAVPRYWLAAGFAVLLAAGGLVAGRQWVLRYDA